MKPRVFLSHSKKDKEYIEQLAMDLRSARIDVWYDDWEIPPGSSLRAKIFEEGISECDLFFVYLTKNSRDSPWVRQELDAAFVVELEMRGGFITIFVDSDDTRQSLSPDLRSRRIPMINSESYSRCLLELTAKSWDALLKKRIAKADENNNNIILKLEKKIAEQDLELAKLRIAGVFDRDKIFMDLSETNLELNGHSISFAEIFQSISENLARGATGTRIESLIEKLYGLTEDQFWELKRDLESEVLGQLVILGLVRVQPPVGEWNEIFYLTDLGKDLAFEIRCKSKKNQDNMPDNNQNCIL